MDLKMFLEKALKYEKGKQIFFLVTTIMCIAVAFATISVGVMYLPDSWGSVVVCGGVFVILIALAAGLVIERTTQKYLDDAIYKVVLRHGDEARFEKLFFLACIVYEQTYKNDFLGCYEAIRSTDKVNNIRVGAEFHFTKMKNWISCSVMGCREWPQSFTATYGLKEFIESVGVDIPKMYLDPIMGEIQK